MNKYNREELLYMFGYCFQVLKTVSDLDQAISAEQNKAYDSIIGKYYRIKKVFNIIILSILVIGFIYESIKESVAPSLLSIFQIALVTVYSYFCYCKSIL